jgi:hypothetical protein
MLTGRTSQHQLGRGGVHALCELKFMKLRFANSGTSAYGGGSPRLPYAKLEADEIDFTLVFVIQGLSLDVTEFQEKIGMTSHGSQF